MFNSLRPHGLHGPLQAAALLLKWTIKIWEESYTVSPFTCLTGTVVIPKASVVQISGLQPKNSWFVDNVRLGLPGSYVRNKNPAFMFFLKFSLTSHLLQRWPFLKDIIQICQCVTWVPWQSDPKLLYTPQLHSQCSRQDGLLGTFNSQPLSGRTHSFKAMLLKWHAYSYKTAHYSGISQISANKEVCLSLRHWKVRKHYHVNRKKGQKGKLWNSEVFKYVISYLWRDFICSWGLPWGLRWKSVCL